VSGVLPSLEPQSDSQRRDCRWSRVAVLGIPVDNLSLPAAVAAILDRLDRPRPSQVCFLNADCVNLSRRNRPYLEVLRAADLVLADGIGLKIAARVAGIRLCDNVNGTDLFPRLCESLRGTGKSLFLLGARPGAADAVCDWVARRYPGVAVAGCRDGYFSPEEEPMVVDQIAQSGADLLLVAFGSPQQDLWINRHLGSLGVKVAMGVGGLFDFYSGRIPRAPVWMRQAGLEWLFRLAQEPNRLWRRYLLGNPRFLAAVAMDAACRLFVVPPSRG
jgi:N-acetylglucosaminyldiphosphoundecaprenol N-acetyl-beta-D-mannosaminyltransferase